MHSRAIHVVVLTFILTLNLAIGQGIVSLAHAQQYHYGEDRQSREANERERAREEGRQEERNRQRQGYNEDSRNRRATDCNMQWDHCARNCNTIRDAYQRQACVGNCNNELQRCQRR